MDATDVWGLVQADLLLPDRFPEIAINPARADGWDAVIGEFIKNAFNGDGTRHNAPSQVEDIEAAYRAFHEH
ncbi:hypothetical protein ACFFTN_16430 [Aminobacter aganoensis]|uniref:Uncharacterized protein n=1 Tax=Aminobacter aganoensis TaxID=83264 RepID=A0A7X0KP59_9HYPH|nr:hypothetical protein [Aminobacter aganoensis]MBB6357824.1 hypothetical protein [Aminobacter aganoensis]